MAMICPSQEEVNYVITHEHSKLIIPFLRVRKLPMTGYHAVVFFGYSGVLPHSLASQDLT